ncbi:MULTISPECIES: PDDEXK family nuclease [Catenuloplanes]|uniref:DUF2726 domain-containing protein n=1 Tax=Catenuloplanes niger TaxID=587534 RepID=A0AAE3ZLM6_9ACTN|nr:DUF2726 domain-containing protein [Catenuloplanes niger]MDR7322087.1 hypothetical protein [Catenuloplanes niger]
MSTPSPLRPVVTAEEQLFARGRWVVQPDRRLSQLVARRPEGVSPNQWNTALRTRCDFVVLDPDTRLPVFAAQFADPAGVDERLDRMLAAVCGAVGLEWVRVVSPILGATTQARRTVEYLLDARAFRDATAFDDAVEPPGPGFRDIVGRLPDGRDGFVNDLSALARAAAVDAYVGRDLADPIIRGLHVTMPDGVAEGWAWVELPEGRHLLERVQIGSHGFDCGVALDRLAEDLAALAVGERLKRLDTTPPVWLSRDDLCRAYDRLQARHPALTSPFFVPL